MPDEPTEKTPGVVDDVTISKEELTWKELARRLDKFFFIVFMASITVLTAAFIVIISLKINQY